MKTVIKSDNLQEMHVQYYPDGFRPEEILTEHFNIPEFKGFSGKISRIITGGMMIVQRQWQITDPIVLEVEHDFPFLKMQFELEGYSIFNSVIRGIPQVEIPGGTQRLFFLPEVKGKLTYPAPRFTLEINLTLEFITGLFGSDLTVLDAFGLGITRFRPVLAATRPLPLTPEMRLRIKELLSCPYKGEFKRMFLQCKVSELLLLQLQQAGQERQETKRINAKDRDKLEYVRTLIESNVRAPLTISALSAACGMNPSKLKQLFKQYSGFTLFGYLSEVRLNEARHMLTERKYSVAEVAYRIGYQHPQHFTKAFKKKFGELPKSVG